MQRARIRLSSTNQESLDKVIDSIKKVVLKTGVKIFGPIPLPTKHLSISTQKNPSGQGTVTWDHFQLRIHKRLLDINADDRSMTLVMKIMFPEDVLVEIELL
jgi:small subunit ribosomal protein S10